MNNATYDLGGNMAIAPTFLTVRIELGEVRPYVCGVDQPQGVTCGELMAEAQERLARLLLTQSAGHALEELNTPESLEHEIKVCLNAIQRYAATPADRCLA